MEEKYYELIPCDRKEYFAGALNPVYQIRALRSFTIEVRDMTFKIDEGQLGGYIYSEDNLAQDGSWVDEFSSVVGASTVRGPSMVCGNVEIKGASLIHDSVIKNQCNIENIVVTGSVLEMTSTEDSSAISIKDSHLFNCYLAGTVEIKNSCLVHGGIYGDAVINLSRVYGDKMDAGFMNHFKVSNSAEIKKDEHCFHTSGIHVPKKVATEPYFYRTKNASIAVYDCGHAYPTIEEYEEHFKKITDDTSFLTRLDYICKLAKMSIEDTKYQIN